MERAWYQVLLFSVTTLLFAAIYFLLFIVPSIPELDRQAAEAARQAAAAAERRAFKERFADKLNSIDGGKYWFHVTDVKVDTETGGIWRHVLNERTGKQTALVVGSDKALVSVDGGTTWTEPKTLRQKLSSMSDMQIEKAAFSPNGKYGVVGAGGRQHTGYFVSVTQDGGQTWNNRPPLSERLRLAEVADGAGVIVGNQGSVYVTQNGGGRWSKAVGLELDETEVLTLATYSADGRVGVVAGDRGSVYVTHDGGKNWSGSGGDRARPRFVAIVGRSISIGASRANFIGMDDAGRVHLLRAFPGIGDLVERSIEQILEEIRRHGIPPQSQLIKDIELFVEERTDNFASKNEEEQKEKLQPIKSGWALSQVDWIRIGTLIVVFFLVAVLVRLQRHYLRLAAFWDSRADAVLLAGSFSTGKGVAFDILVGALATDLDNFKPPPTPGLEAVLDRLRPRRE